MGPLLARHGHFAVNTAAGGDDIGRRRIDTHLQVFDALGAAAATQRQIRAARRRTACRAATFCWTRPPSRPPRTASWPPPWRKGTTILRNAASEPHVQDLCRLLVRMGCPIDGIGSNTLTIDGQTQLGGAEIHVSPDFVEVGSYIGMGAITHGEVRIVGVVPEHLRMMEMVFVDRLGVRMHLEEEPGCAARRALYAGHRERSRSCACGPDFGGAVPKIDDAPWPAFPPDLMSIALVTATQAQGTVIVHEKMYESRLFFVDKLIAMGAQIILCDPHRAVVVGPSRLTGQHVSSPDIRAGMALVLAALVAKATTADRQCRTDRSRLPGH